MATALDTSSPESMNSDYKNASSKAEKSVFGKILFVVFALILNLFLLFTLDQKLNLQLFEAITNLLGGDTGPIEIDPEAEDVEVFEEED